MIPFITTTLFRHEVVHGLVALPFAYYMWLRTKHYGYTLAVVFVVYALDADHLIDYFLYYGAHFSLRDFFGLEYFTQTRRALVIFHAWEWMILAGFMTRLRGWKSIGGVLFLAMIPHLVYDSYWVGSGLFYSIIYRLSRGFIVM